MRRIALALLIMLALGGCELLDQSCPAGQWRPRAGQPCEPLPVSDAGTDAGPRDAGSMDADAPDAASADAEAPDAEVPDGGMEDAAVDAAVDDAG